MQHLEVSTVKSSFFPLDGDARTHLTLPVIGEFSLHSQIRLDNMRANVPFRGRAGSRQGNIANNSFLRGYSQCFSSEIDEGLMK